VQCAVGVALDPRVGQERVDVAESASIVVELVLGEVNRAALARNFDYDRVTSRPAEADRGTPGNLEVTRQRSVFVTHVEIRLVTVVPPRPQLDHPTGQGHGDLLVALADGRCLELSYPLLEIRAAVAPKICRFRWVSSQGKRAKGQPERSCDGDAAGRFCQSPKHPYSRPDAN